MFKKIVRPILFKFDSESIHNITLKSLKNLKYILPLLKPFLNHSNLNLKIEKQGLIFPNPIGLGAGFDKNCYLLDYWGYLGFGFAEMGTITINEQPGNIKPRLFRYEKDLSLVNRMGFNSEGIKKILEKLNKWKRRFNIPIGFNLGKSKETELDNAINDYLVLIKNLENYASYFTINISSPNTLNLRKLQQKKYLRSLLLEIRKATLKPILLKISPDLIPTELDDVCECIIEAKINGIICTNTTTHIPPYIKEKGGLSGHLLLEKSNFCLNFVRNKLPDNLLFVGCGGILNENSFKSKIDLGADLVNIYSGYVFNGPLFPKRLCQIYLGFKNGIN